MSGPSGWFPRPKHLLPRELEDYTDDEGDGPQLPVVSSSHLRDRERIAAGRAWAVWLTAALRALNLILAAAGATCLGLTAYLYAGYRRAVEAGTAPPFDARDIATQPWLLYLLAAAGLWASGTALCGLRAAGTASRLLLGGYMFLLAGLLTLQGGVVTAVFRYEPWGWLPPDVTGDEKAAAAIVATHGAIVQAGAVALLVLQAACAALAVGLEATLANIRRALDRMARRRWRARLRWRAEAGERGAGAAAAAEPAPYTFWGMSMGGSGSVGGGGGVAGSPADGRRGLSSPLLGESAGEEEDAVEPARRPAGPPARSGRLSRARAGGADAAAASGASSFDEEEAGGREAGARGEPAGGRAPADAPAGRALASGRAVAPAPGAAGGPLRSPAGGPGGAGGPMGAHHKSRADSCMIS